MTRIQSYIRRYRFKLLATLLLASKASVARAAQIGQAAYQVEATRHYRLKVALRLMLASLPKGWAA